MSEPQTCAGTTKAGLPCQAKVLLYHSPDGRRWCNLHRPSEAVLVRPEPPERPICAGTRRDGSPCVTNSSGTVEYEGREVFVCSWHRKVFEEHGTLRPPPRIRQRIPSVVEAEEIEGPDVVVVRAPVEAQDAPAGGNGHTETLVPLSLRDRVQRSAEDNFEEIENALRAALQGASKARNVTCPNCAQTFGVHLPDYGAAIASAKLLLELVVSRPKQPEVEQPVWGEGEDLSGLSDEQLRRLAFPEEYR